MSSNEGITVDGIVMEVMPSRVFRVELPNGHRVLAHTSGKMRMDSIRIDTGDRVTMKMSPFDLSKGCITVRQDKLNA
ncbi:MAG: translation initiation factor IF-1 [Verrucomicrobia bacterium]|nr:MAG: translation initiation factor IF-1 [Verrucomicrobiota bacterium]